MQKIYIDSDNIISFGPVTDSATEGIITIATVTFTITQSDVAVTGALNISMPHTTGGVYQGTLQDTVVLVPDELYFLQITCISAGSKLYKKIPCVAVYDGE